VPARPIFGCRRSGIEPKMRGNRVLFGSGRRFRAFTSLRDMSLHRNGLKAVVASAGP